MKKLVIIFGMLMLLMVASASAVVIDDFDRSNGPIDGTLSNQGYAWSATGNVDIFSNYLGIDDVESAIVQFDHDNANILEFSLFSPDVSGNILIYIMDTDDIPSFSFYTSGGDLMFYDDFSTPRTVISGLSAFTWYKLGMKLNPATNSVSVYLDDNLVFDDGLSYATGIYKFYPMGQDAAANYFIDDLKSTIDIASCDSTLSTIPCIIADQDTLTLTDDVYIDTDTVTGNVIEFLGEATIDGNGHTIYLNETVNPINFVYMFGGGTIENLNVDIVTSSSADVPNGILFDIVDAPGYSFVNVNVTVEEATSLIGFKDSGSTLNNAFYNDVNIYNYPAGVTVFDSTHGQSVSYNFNNLHTYNSGGEDFNWDVTIPTLDVTDSSFSGGISSSPVCDINLQYTNNNLYVGYDNVFTDMSTYPDSWNDLLSSGGSGENAWVSVESGSVFDEPANIWWLNLPETGDTYTVYKDGVAAVEGVDYTLDNIVSNSVRISVTSWSNWSLIPPPLPMTLSLSSPQGTTLTQGSGNYTFVYTVNNYDGVTVPTYWIEDDMAMPISSGLYTVTNVGNNWTFEVYPDGLSVGSYSTGFTMAGATGSNVISFTVEAANLNPYVEGVSDNRSNYYAAGATITMTDSEVVEFTPDATDADGTIVSYNWDNGNADFSTGSTRIIYGSDFVAGGSYTVWLEAVDNDGGTGSSTFTLDIIATNTAPTITGFTAASGEFTQLDNEVATYYIAFEDLDGDATVSATIDGNPIVLDGPAVWGDMIAYGVGSTLGVGTHTLEATISDGVFSDNDSITFNVTASNTPPVIVNFYPSGHSTVLDNETLEFIVNYNDSDGDAGVYFFLNGTPVALSGPNSIIINGSEWPVGINYTVMAVVNDSVYSDNISGTFEVVSTAVPVVYSGSSGGSSVSYIVDDEDNIIGMQTNTGIIYYDNKDYLATLTPKDDAALFSLFGDFGGDTPWYQDLWQKIMVALKNLFMRGN